MKTKKLTLCALLVATAAIFGYIESLFPVPLPVPGIKLGLGNIVVLTSLYIYDRKTAAIIMLIKVILSSILFSAPSALFFSLTGGIFSLIAMIITKKLKFNIISVSISGGIFHNIAQLLTAYILLSNINLLYYLPMLIISGTIVATITGSVSGIILKRLKNVLHNP